MTEQEKLLQATEAFKKSVDETKAIAEEIKGRYEHNDKVTEAMKLKADEALTKTNEMSAQIEELKKYVSTIENRDNQEGDQSKKSIGQKFVDDERVKQFLGQTNHRGKVNIEMKTILTDQDSAGVLVQDTRLPGIMATPDRRLTIRDLITPGNMNGSVIGYVRETGFTNNADMVAEGARKPESDIKFELEETSARVIAHYIKASRQILSDAPMLASYIDGRLRFGLALKEEDQLLNGDGKGQNLKGIIPQATAFNPAIAKVEKLTKIDTLRLAMLQAVLAEYPATGHVLNPIDWTEIETTKDENGRYIIGQPQGVAYKTLWGLPVVETQAIASGKFLTGAFKLGAQIFDRWQASVEVATENEDDFVKNMVTILAEQRLALAVYRPECFVFGDLAGAGAETQTATK